MKEIDGLECDNNGLEQVECEALACCGCARFNYRGRASGEPNVSIVKSGGSFGET